MCGLVGIVGNLGNREETTMKKLLMFDYFRGPDSTGVAGIRHSGDAKIGKYNSYPPALFEMARYREAIVGTSCKVFMGHNRAATKGAVNETNAHPFQCGHIIGAHNGTLLDKDKAALETKLGRRFEVDSHALFAAIAEFGIEETIGMLTVGEFQTGSSAYALTWYDQSDGTMNFLRNDFRPLWFGWEENFQRLYYGSTWEIIDNAMRCEPGIIKMFVEDKTKFKYWSFESDKHYKFDVNTIKNGSKRVKPTVKTIKGKEPIVVSHGTTGNPNPFGFRGPVSTHHTSTTNSSTTTSHGSHTSSGSTKGKGVKQTVDFLHLVGDIGRPFAGYIDEARFNDITKYGCHWCGAPVLIEDKGITIYDREDLAFCSGCSGHDGETDPPHRVYVRGAQLDQLL